MRCCAALFGCTFASSAQVESNDVHQLFTCAICITFYADLVALFGVSFCKFHVFALPLLNNKMAHARSDCAVRNAHAMFDFFLWRVIQKGWNNGC